MLSSSLFVSLLYVERKIFVFDITSTCDIFADHSLFRKLYHISVISKEHFSVFFYISKYLVELLLSGSAAGKPHYTFFTEKMKSWNTGSHTLSQ